MSSTSDPTVSTPNYQRILSDALAKYTKQTGKILFNHPLAAKIRGCDSSDAILGVYQEQAQAFHQSRNGDPRLFKWLRSIVNSLHVLSTATLEIDVSLEFPPAQAVFSGIGVLLSTAKFVCASYDALVDLFECVENVLRCPEIYIEIPSTPAMTEIVMKIMVDLLSVFALATKQINQGQFKTYTKKLLGENDIEAALQRLDRFSLEESRATVTQTLGVVHGLVNKMVVVMGDGKASTQDIREALVLLQREVEQINKTNRDGLQENVRRWLSAPDSSTNHKVFCEAHHSGTSMWFTQGDTFKEWKITGSLLWIHGSPGSGKSVLCSTIIEHFQDMHKAGLATVSYFYFDFRDSAKRDARGLLSSLLVQLCAQSDSFYEVLSDLYSTHDRGSRQPSYQALIQCLEKMLEFPGHGPVFVIIDALDECPNSSGLTSPRGQVLQVVEELIDLHLPHLHLCLTSRPEEDIRDVLEPLTAHCVSLHGESGHNQDISNYIDHVVRSHPKMWEWRTEDKRLVIDTLTQRGRGIFRLVDCQLVTLSCQCYAGLKKKKKTKKNLSRFSQDIQRALGELPKTLDAIYEHTLQSIDKGKQGRAYHIFQCLIASVRPLRVEELVGVLAIQLDAETIPRYYEDWGLGDAEEAVLSMCSTLIAIVNDHGSRIVQFSHFSVQEYLTSTRLAQPDHASHYHVRLPAAHTFLARACLSILLQLDHRADRDRLKDFPLATYAAQHWVDHAQFENASSLIQDEMERLFDQDKPHFTAWIWVYDVDKYPGGAHMTSTHPEKPRAVPLYYAALCGFRDVAERLAVTHPQDVNARCGNRATPLHAALHNGHLEVAQSLLEHGADINARNYTGRTPLHVALERGDAEALRLLTDRGADPNLQGGVFEETPLYMASYNGRVEASRLLLRRGADPNHQGRWSGTPLHGASENGHHDVVRLLIEYGANVNARGKDGGTPLHRASSYGKLEAARVLLECGANVDARDERDLTPLHSASSVGQLEVMRLLLDRGADVDIQDRSFVTPLRRAAEHGRLDVARVLLEYGADPHIRDNEGRTPPQLANEKGYHELAQLLSEHTSEGT